MDLGEPPQFSSTHLKDGARIELRAKKHAVRYSMRKTPTPKHDTYASMPAHRDRIDGGPAGGGTPGLEE